jgi:cell wall-associated NlpC family hydrolase
MPLPIRKSLLACAFVALALVLAPATASTPHLVASQAALAGSPPGHPEGRPSQRSTAVRMSLGERAATLAVRMVGTPYRWGGESPGGFDCSGLVRWAYLQFGINLPHHSAALNGVGEAVSRSNLESGDILVFSGLGHVGLYLGGGRMVHAPQSGKTVEVVNLGTSHYGARLVSARRLVAS